MTRISICPERKNKDISPLLYGIFFEDINYGGDGGLHAELVPNRSFEYFDRSGCADMRAMCWEALSGTRFTIETERPLNDIHKNYARISGGARCGVRNSGFAGDGISVQSGRSFKFSCYARADEDICLSAVISGGGKTLASADMEVAGSEWKKYSAELTAEGGCENAFLSVILKNGGSADIEFVSLFPKDTFMNRENGMRKDIAELLKKLSPKFMRFPGGCIVEGRSFENMYNWKDTVGPVETRPTNWNRWQMEEYQHLGGSAADYFQSYGIGFYEYFLLCEDIVAKPVPVINCGMTCQWHEALLVDTGKLEPFVQDALDLIEFANGSTETKWGRVRAEMGHPEPFGLEYIGIGNEQWGNEYFERYEIFEEKLGSAHPEIKLITSAGWKDRGPDFELAYDWLEKHKNRAYAVDEHFYKEPEWFLANIGRYDNYDRSLPKVMIGEYAAHTSQEIKERGNTWYAALCEAAFLIGVEENGDHVVMSCYAPLLGRLGHSQWQPNLIWFDGEKAYKTPSWYVQRLFSESLPEYTVKCSCDDDDIKITAGVRGENLIIKLVNISDMPKSAEIEGVVGKVTVTELFGGGGKKQFENTGVKRSVKELDGGIKLRPLSVTVCESRRR